MVFTTDQKFATDADAADVLSGFREHFIIPQHNGKDMAYLCGNSLGLQPKQAGEEISRQLHQWALLGVEGWFDGEQPWLQYHKQLAQPLAQIVGALPQEVTVMNTLTVNLHLLMVSFYQPTAKKFKIIMEGGAFPSDQYAIESQVKFHGYDPAQAIIEIFAREGEHTLRTSDILSTIEANAGELALVLFSGINYYTGQFFDIEAITQAAHNAGAFAGFDLAHAAGNVGLQLHNWQVDFACWCSYKYLNSGPGGIAGAFVHQQHFNNTELPRFAGWWGYSNDTRFKMQQGFKPEHGAEGWQVSTSPILLMAVHRAALNVFTACGGLEPLIKKQQQLTAYLEYLINAINQQKGRQALSIITPANPAERGSQLSIICENGKATFDHLVANGVLGDWREPDVIRLSPVPLYNSFTDVYQAYDKLNDYINKF
jgi:kynureninase